jgi:hypothetical protein
VRLCQFPDCRTEIADCVPKSIIHCGQHQYTLIRLKEIFLKEKLPQEDIDFIYAHLGGCNAYPLFKKHLGIPEQTFSHCIKRGWVNLIPRMKKSAHWFVPLKEMIRIIVLKRNWITVRNFASRYNLSPVTLKLYVDQGYFGSSQIDLSGHLAIHKNQQEGFLPRFRLIFSLRRDLQRWSRSFVRKNEVTPGWLATRLKISSNTIYYWQKKGFFPVRRRGKSGNRQVIKVSDFIAFAQKAILGEYHFKNLQSRHFIPIFEKLIENPDLLLNGRAEKMLKSLSRPAEGEFLIID